MKKADDGIQLQDRKHIGQIIQLLWLNNNDSTHDNDINDAGSDTANAYKDQVNLIFVAKYSSLVVSGNGFFRRNCWNYFTLCQSVQN